MIKPVNGHVLISWDRAPETQTAFGLVIPNHDHKRGETATVIAIAKDSVLEVGQTVLFNKLAGRFVKEGIEELLLIKEEEIFAVLD